MKTKHATIAIFIIFISLLIPRAGRAAQTPAGLWLNQPAPSLSLSDSNGKTVSLDSYKNKNVVVLAFWDPQNPPSVDDLKELDKMLKDKSLDDVVALTVTRGREVKDRDDAKKKFKDAGLGFRMLFETRDDLSSSNARYQVWLTPAYFIIDKNGNLAAPMIMSTSEEVGGKSFKNFLLGVVNGKKSSGCDFTPEQRDEKVYKKLYDLAGKQAPGFSATDTGGVKQSLSYYLGVKNVLLVFWSPTCPHCRRELPHISDYDKKWADKQGVQILAICMDDSAEGVKGAKDFFGTFGIDIPIIVDKDAKISSAYGVASVPSLLLVNKKGIVKKVIVGEFNMPGDVLKCQFDKMK